MLKGAPTDSTVTSSPNGSRQTAVGPQQQQQQEVTQPLKQQPFLEYRGLGPVDEDGDMSSDMTPLAPGDFFSWQKGRQIGQGAFGTVYLALVHATGQEIAVKQVSLPRDAANNGKVANHIRTLESEVNLLRRLRHENIVRYLGTERTEDCLNIFLEYVSGGPISNKLAEFGPLREETIRVYTKQILRGLEYLHQSKVMHRDIKGANILVDTNGVVKLADFGASRQIEELATIGDGSRSIRGTANWMAPEVIKQSGHGRAADIWSLGCVVVEMATGRPPWFNFSDPYAVMYHVASTRDLPAMPDWLSPHARDFIALCFNRVPRERPNATRLLQHPWLQSVVVPRAAGPPPSLLPIPATLAPAAPQARPNQQQQPAGLAPVPPKLAVLPAGAQPLPPPQGLRSPPSPTNDKSESQCGSPAAGVTSAGYSTPTSTRATAQSTLAGPSGGGQRTVAQSPLLTVRRPAVPPLPLDAMKMGFLPTQQQQQQPSQAAGAGIFMSPVVPQLPPQHSGSAVPSAVPSKPPLPPSAASARGPSAQNQNDALVDSEAVHLQLQAVRQQQQQQPQRPNLYQQQRQPDLHDSICMGVGMTISIGPEVTSTMRDFNPINEPSWMPEQLLQQRAFFERMRNMGTPPASPPESPTRTPAYAAAGSKPVVSGSGSAADNSGSTSGPDVPSGNCVADNTKLPPVADVAAPAHGSPRSGAGTHRSGAGTWRSGAGTQRGTARTARAVPSRPPLAGLFAAAYEDVGIMGTGTLDSARAKQWRDELVAELDAERLRAGVATSMAATSVGPMLCAKPSVADF
ncbi:hypothetical protein PLESTB_000151300 [Pleodorina starrii]|uniref:Protein kinase domain-containing protein n=1 Tax=Pleodorina starrii TaxID=330485 RepID=A0A9W6EY79_9CHLO|nr:hypothetical protein PLESTB_000151300 [Pleodorina starrii]